VQERVPAIYSITHSAGGSSLREGGGGGRKRRGGASESCVSSRRGCRYGENFSHIKDECLVLISGTVQVSVTDFMHQFLFTFFLTPSSRGQALSVLSASTD
jgi:hypothetical protein